MKRELAVLLLLCMAVVGMASAANYMYEKANIKGVGYKNVETIIQTQAGLAGNKLVEKESGSGTSSPSGPRSRPRGTPLDQSAVN